MMDFESHATTTAVADSQHQHLRVFWMHSAALLVLLLALLPAFSHGVALRDEGVYLAQADNLAEGHWWAPRPFSEIDPDGARYAISHGGHRATETVPYARHALYPLLLAGPYAVAGIAGALALSVTGSWLAAVLTGLLTREVRPGWDIAAMWLTGIASPVLFDAFTVVGHSIAAAACAGVLLCNAIARRATPWWLIPSAAAGTIALVAVRSEGAIAAGVIGLLSAGAALLDRDPLPSRRRFRVVLGLVVLLTAIATYWVDDRVAQMITGVADAGSGSIDRDPNAISSAWASLLRPWQEDQRAASVAALLVVTAPVLAALSWRFLPRLRLLGMGFLLLGAAAGVATNANVGLVTGLLPAFPLLLPGLLMLRGRDLVRPIVAWLTAICVSATGLLLLTVYGEGGALEWGGRFFHVLLPALIPLMVIGIANVAEILEGRERVIAGVAAGVLSLSVSLVGVRWNLESRNAASALVDDTMAAAAVYGVPPPIVVATFAPGDSGRYFWRQSVDGPGVLAAGNLGGLLDLLEDADANGIDRVLVVSDANPEFFASLATERLDESGWSVSESKFPRAGSFYLYEIESDPTDDSS